MSSCLGRAAVPVKRVWRGLLGARPGPRSRRQRRTTKLSTYVPVNAEHDDGVGVGLGRLRKDVRTCEYHDVHVMWEMLSGDGGRGGGGEGRGDATADDDDEAAASGKAKTRRVRERKPAPWRRLVAYCCTF